MQGQGPWQISVSTRRRAKRAENFYNYFPSLQSIDQTFFFYHFMNKLFFSHKQLNKLFIFQNLLSNLFFHKKTIAPPPGIKWSAPKYLVAVIIGLQQLPHHLSMVPTKRKIQCMAPETNNNDNK